MGRWYGPQSDYCSCCVACDIFYDDFNRSDGTNLGSDWDEVSGAWAIDTNRLSCTSDGIAICQTAHPDAEARQKVAVDVYGTDDGDSMIVIVDYVDSDNYHYASVEVGNNLLRFYKRTGGSTSQLGDSVSITMAAEEWHSLEVCFSGTAITASVNGGVFHSRATTEHGGLYAGLGAALTSAGPALFDDFNYDKRYSSTNTICLTCSYCEGCLHGAVPAIIKAVVSGMADDVCSNCDNLDATYYVPFDETGSTPTACRWEYEHGLSCDDCNTIGDEPIIIEISSGGRIRVWLHTATEPLVGACSTSWEQTATGSALNCMSLSSLSIPYWQEVESCCDGSGATCLLTSQ